MEESKENEKSELLLDILKLAIGILITLVGIFLNKKFYCLVLLKKR